MNTLYFTALTPQTKHLCLAALVYLLVACSHIPEAVKQLRWYDHWGDRGEGVLARDYANCSELVESRRSALAGCMLARGWSVYEQE